MIWVQPPVGGRSLRGSILGKKDKIIALDILPMDPMEGVDFIQGDFREQAVLDQLYAVLDGAPVDLVMSDMAPNMSGNKGVDQPRAIYLASWRWNGKTVLQKTGFSG